MPTSIEEKLAKLRGKKQSQLGSGPTPNLSGPHIIVGVPVTVPTTTDKDTETSDKPTDETYEWRTFTPPEFDHTNTARITLGTDPTNTIVINKQSAYPALGASITTFEFHQHEFDNATEYTANINVVQHTAALAHIKLGTSVVTATDTSGRTTATQHLPADGISRAFEGTALLLERPSFPPSTTSPIILAGIVVILRGILDPTKERTIVPRRLIHLYQLQTTELQEVIATLTTSIDKAQEHTKHLQDPIIGADAVNVIPTIGQFRQKYIDIGFKDRGNYQQDPKRLGPELIGYVKEPFTLSNNKQIGWVIQPIDPALSDTRYLVRNSDYCGPLDKYAGERNVIAHVGQRVVFTPTPPPEPKEETNNSGNRGISPIKRQRTEDPLPGTRHVRILPALTLAL